MKVVCLAVLLSASASPAIANEVYCEAQGPGVSVVARQIDGYHFGGPILSDQCRQIASSSTNGLVCEPNGPFVYLTNIYTGRHLAANAERMERCFDAIRTSSVYLVCVPDGPGFSYVASIDDGSRRGSSLVDDDCYAQIGQ